jgi:hypothetical protein
MEPLELKVDKAKIKKFAVDFGKNPNEDSSRYNFLAMQAASEAHELGKKTSNYEKQEYFGRVEDVIAIWRESLYYVAQLEMLDGIVENPENMIELANRRLSALGMNAGLDTKTQGMNREQKIDVHIGLHYQSLEELTNIYNNGLKKQFEEPELKAGHAQLLGYIGQEIQHANKLFKKRFSLF